MGKRMVKFEEQKAWAGAISGFTSVDGHRVDGASIIPAEYRGNPANVLVAINLGSTMGLSPAESLYRIHVIQGRPSMSAELMAARVRLAGHKLHVSSDPQTMTATCTITRFDDPENPFTVWRDLKWAQSMALGDFNSAGVWHGNKPNDNWSRQPLTMLEWRAISACARVACSEAMYGIVYTPDEVEDVQTVEVLDDEQIELARKIRGTLSDHGVVKSDDFAAIMMHMVGKKYKRLDEMTLDDMRAVMADAVLFEHVVEEQVLKGAGDATGSGEGVLNEGVQVDEQEPHETLLTE